MSGMITLEDVKRLLSKVPMSSPAEVALYVAQNIKGQCEYLATAAKVTAEVPQAEAAAARAKTDAAMARSLAEQASALVDAMEKQLQTADPNTDAGQRAAAALSDARAAAQTMNAEAQKAEIAASIAEERRVDLMRTAEAASDEARRTSDPDIRPPYMVPIPEAVIYMLDLAGGRA